MSPEQQVQFFKVCRKRLGMSVRELQVALCLADSRTIRRIETGENTILGTTWVALAYMLEENGHRDLANSVRHHVCQLRAKLHTGHFRDSREPASSAD